MGVLPTTRASLLVRLREPGDAEAWREFVRVYGPVIYGCARKRQVQDADAADLMQEVLRSVMKAARQFDYDPKRGSFRSWLFTVTHNKLLDLRERQRRGQGAGGTTAQERLDQQPAAEDQSLWGGEYRRRLFALAPEKVRGGVEEATWPGVWAPAVGGEKPQE